MIKHQHQLGLSLIELMIGILLSSLIITGVLYIFNGSRASSLLIEAESKMLDEAQYSMENLTSVIRMAGYTMDEKTGSDDIVIAPTIEPLVYGDVIQGIEGGTDSPDSITVWYEGNPDGSVFDCLGNSVLDNTDGTSILMSNTYFIGAEGTLSCTRTVNDLAGTGDTTQPLINDVADLQILYGIDTDVEPDGAVNTYKIFSEITATEQLRIVTVMLELTLEAIVVGDTLEKTFSSAIYLRNRSI